LLLEQGVGYEGRRFTRLQTTGTVANEKLGYAIVHAVDGTTGPYPTQARLQPSFLSGNFSLANQTLLTYGTSSAYMLRNDLVKLKYSFSPSTSFEATALSADSFSDKTGNGDNCYFSEGQQLYNACRIRRARNVPGRAHQRQHRQRRLSGGIARRDAR
jgi:hypothetical protein